MMCRYILLGESVGVRRTFAEIITPMLRAYSSSISPGNILDDKFSARFWNTDVPESKAM